MIKVGITRVQDILSKSLTSFRKEHRKKLMQIVLKVLDGLFSKGILMTGSNQDAHSLVDGGPYQKTDDGFVKIWSSGNASPIENHIITFARSKNS